MDMETANAMIQKALEAKGNKTYVNARKMFLRARDSYKEEKEYKKAISAGLHALICSFKQHPPIATEESLSNELGTIEKLFDSGLRLIDNPDDRRKELHRFEGLIRNVVRDSLIRLGKHKQADTVYYLQMELRRRMAKDAFLKPIRALWRLIFFEVRDLASILIDCKACQSEEVDVETLGNLREWLTALKNYSSYSALRFLLGYNIVFMSVTTFGLFVMRVCMGVLVLATLCHLLGGLQKAGFLGTVSFFFQSFLGLVSTRFAPRPGVGDLFVTLNSIYSFFVLALIGYAIAHDVARKAPLAYPKWDDLVYDEFLK